MAGFRIIVRTDDIRISYTVQDEDSFRANVQVRIIGYDIDITCIIMYCQDP